LFIPELGRFVTLRLSARALKSVTKLGLLPYLRKQGLALKDIA
jgi:large subunit ribosomal protein L28